MSDGSQDHKVSFKQTLNLPQTDFPIRPNAHVDDPKLLERWQQHDLYTKTFELNAGNDSFILHDGPPYANGNIHLGHTYNKVLKDIVTKSQRMLGKHVPVTPGWDCHGLPIEHKVSQQHPDASPAQLKAACRAWANQWVEVQREEFKQLGVLMDFAHPYITMDPKYEADITRAFAQFVAGQYVSKKNKTVPWCPSCQTVLASAEIEYAERKDPSLYVLFELEQAAAQKLFPHLGGKQVNLLVWTTTPWTLPLNRAVTLRPNTRYTLLNINDTYVLVGDALVSKVAQTVGVDKTVVGQTTAEDLVGAQVHHPFVEGLTVPILSDNFVSLDDGTACVHSAPGCGPEDYELGVRHGLEIFSPVAPDGTYTKGIQPTELEGMSIADAQGWVIKKLVEKNRLLYKTSIRHAFPHCWRCQGGLIFRATKQWFVNLERDNLRQRALDAIAEITFLPAHAIHHLQALVQNRLEWCISRQRVWGVPIVALLCADCGDAYTTPDMVNMVADGIEKQGVEYWDAVTVDQLLPAGHTCSCGGTSFEKETDILDVWFDSGVSHYAVLQQRPALGYPADLYLEGIDQHRGWFQSSLLTSLVLNTQPSMKAILTHGFVVDGKGQKMSKSRGNVVLPKDIIEQLGTDGLRLWAASIDYENDAVVSKVLLDNVAQVYRKIRNTCRFLLSNLYDFDIDADHVPFEKLRALDRYALEQLGHVAHTIVTDYTSGNITGVFHRLGDYCAVELSSFYLDIIKDRLYVEQADGHARRSAQTACWYILDTLTRVMAPVLSFTAELVSDEYQKNKSHSIHLQPFAAPRSLWVALADHVPPLPTDAPFGVTPSIERRRDVAGGKRSQWQVLRDIRSAVLKAIEAQREQGVIKHSLEAQVALYFDTDVAKTLAPFFAELTNTGQTPDAFFAEWLIVSQVDVRDTRGELAQSAVPGVYVQVAQAAGDKCPRCWNWDITQHEHKLCRRCQQVLGT